MASAKEPVILALHVRSGIVALNVVTAALDADPRTQGVEVGFAKTTGDLCAAAAAAHARGAQPVVAFSFYSTDAAPAARELRDVRAALADAGVPALFIVGGVHATAEPRATLAMGFDLAVLGEGEATFVELVAALRVGADPRALPGTAHLDEHARLVKRAPGPRRPLDDFPAFNVRYGKWNPIEITRGCVYACSFCQTPYMFKARFRHRSVEDVRRHVAALRRADGSSRYVRFLSPTSLSYGSDDESLALDRVEALLAAVREEAGPGAKIYFGTFPSEVRPEHVTRESLSVLQRWVDNDSLVIGAQSGSDRVLEQTRRGHDVRSVIEAVERSLEFGFRPDVDFLLGLPGEERADREASIALAERLVAMGARIHAHSFMPLPGTPLRDAVPAEVEDDVLAAMKRFEGTGALYGQWQKQIVLAQDLVRARSEAASRE